MAQGDGACGTVVWAVVETVTGKEVGSGRLAVGAEDVTVAEHRTAENMIYYRKSVRLTGPFQFAIDEHPDRRAEDLKGFAMMGINDDVQAYSWEWFNVSGPNEATKLQEEGKDRHRDRRDGLRLRDRPHRVPDRRLPAPHPLLR